MRFNISVLALLLPLVTLAQEPKKESPLSFYGFVRNDFYLDTYKGVNAFHDLFYLYPNYIGVDAISMLTDIESRKQSAFKLQLFSF